MMGIRMIITMVMMVMMGMVSRIKLPYVYPL